MNDKTSPASGNRPYTTPVIQEFGNIREITQSIGNTGGKDGGSGSTSRSKV